MKAIPLITQMKPTFFSVDCGMTYVIRLSDGRFIIIDSGYGEYDEPDKLLSLLEKQNISAGLPEIAAWFFTHPHNDHIGGFIKFSEKFADKILLRKIYYNFPSMETCVKACNMNGFLSSIEKFGAEIVTPKTNEILSFSDAVFHVLYTTDDLNVDTWNINETSLVMRMTLGNYSVMWLGDIQEIGSDTIVRKFSSEELKSDFLQVGHHGYLGGSDALYRAVDPSFLLWPIPETRYPDMIKHPCNQFFTESKNIRMTFVGGIEETVIDMTKPVKSPYSYEPTKIVADFSKKSVSDLNWSCVIGGGMGYSPVDLSFGDNNCSVKTRINHCLLQFIQRGQVAVSSRYLFKLNILPNVKCESLGLIYDCVHPTDPDGYEVYTIEHEAGKELDIMLELDRTKCEAFITVNGIKDAVSLKTNEPCPLILYIKDGELTISDVTFENL